MARAEVRPLEIEALLRANDISTTGESYSAFAREQHSEWREDEGEEEGEGADD